jgi:alpha-amylase
LDYETFGEHHWAETGIFEFLKALPYEVDKWENLRWALPSELVKQFKPVGEFDVFELATISWADLEMDTSAWLGNEVQRFVFNKLQALEEKVRKLNDHNLLEVWRHLQASDLLHHLCTKSMADGTVHAYFSCFDNPFQGFVALTNAVTDFAHEVERRLER